MSIKIDVDGYLNSQWEQHCRWEENMKSDQELADEGNEAFYEWERTVYGDNPCDYVLSDEDRLMWVQGYVMGVKHEANR